MSDIGYQLSYMTSAAPYEVCNGEGRQRRRKSLHTNTRKLF